MIRYGADARKRMSEGISKLVKTVSVTLGPRGRNVAMEKPYGGPLITKDGVSVAKEIEFEDKYENMGALLVKEAASKTSDDAGDGTTSSTVLAGYLYQEGLKLVEAGMAPVPLKRGMDKALAMVIDQIYALSVPVSTAQDIENIAAISANGDREIGRIISEAVAKVGRDGVVHIEEGQTAETTIEVTDGMKIDRGWLLPEFCTNPEQQETVFHDAYILVTDREMTTARPMVELLNRLVEESRPLVIIAPDFDGDAVPTFLQNHINGVLQSCLIKAPGFGYQQQAILQDIAYLTGAELISKDLGMTFDGITLEMLGEAKRIRITARDTIITDGAGSDEDIEARVTQIRAEIDRSGSEYDKDKLRERMSKLLGGVCVIKVGAPTELALKEMKARMEDALYATRSSIEEGIVSGGGSTYLRAAQRVEQMVAAAKEGELDYELPISSDEWEGFRLVLRACDRVMWTVVQNAGKSGDLFVAKVQERDEDFIGVDATDMQIKDMLEAGIIDPAKVVRSALTNAVSVVGTLLTMECAISKDNPEPMMLD